MLSRRPFGTLDYGASAKRKRRCTSNPITLLPCLLSQLRRRRGQHTASRNDASRNPVVPGPLAIALVGYAEALGGARAAILQDGSDIG